MKKHTIIFHLFTILLLCSCSTTGIFVDVLEPAEITVTPAIQKVAVINRSLPTKEHKANSISEAVATLEPLLADRDASYTCISTLVESLNDAPRFKASLFPDSIYRGTGVRKMPEKLEWPIVSLLCGKTGADALIVLEYYDSNSQLAIGIRSVGSEAAWRLYYPVDSIILDEKVINEDQEWSNKDDNTSVPGSKYDGIQVAASTIGRDYARHISPRWVQQMRLIYVKGNPDMEMAKSLARSGKWNEATDLWKKYSEDKNADIAGKACYNMAVASETMDKLDVAIEWADRAYTQYKNKKALDYSNLLKGRIAKRETVDKQLNAKQ